MIAMDSSPEWTAALKGPPNERVLELDCCVRAIMSDGRFNVADFLRRIRESRRARSGKGPRNRRELITL